MRKNWSPYAWKLLLVVGLVTLLIINYHLEFKVKNHVQTTFHFLPMYWFQPIAGLVTGIYISLFSIKVWSVKWNWAFISCVAAPCFIIAFYFPVIYTIIQYTTSDPNNFSVPFPYWLMKINAHGIPSIVAGLTLILGMFGHTDKSKSNRDGVLEKNN